MLNRKTLIAFLAAALVLPSVSMSADKPITKSHVSPGEGHRGCGRPGHAPGDPEG